MRRHDSRNLLTITARAPLMEWRAVRVICSVGPARPRRHRVIVCVCGMCVGEQQRADT